MKKKTRVKSDLGSCLGLNINNTDAGFSVADPVQFFGYGSRSEFADPV